MKTEAIPTPSQVKAAPTPRAATWMRSGARAEYDAMTPTEKNDAARRAEANWSRERGFA